MKTSNVTPETIKLFGKKDGVMRYNGKQVSFKEHNDDYDLVLKDGETFIVKGLKVWQPASAKIKFTLSMSEKIKLVCSSSDVLTAPKTKSSVKQRAAEIDAMVSEMNNRNVLNSLPKARAAKQAIAQFSLAANLKKYYGDFHITGLKYTKGYTYGTLNKGKQALCHVNMDPAGNIRGVTPQASVQKELSKLAAKLNKRDNGYIDVDGFIGSMLTDYESLKRYKACMAKGEIIALTSKLLKEHDTDYAVPQCYAIKTAKAPTLSNMQLIDKDIIAVLNDDIKAA